MEISAALVNSPGSHWVVLRTRDSEHVLSGIEPQAGGGSIAQLLRETDAVAEVHDTLRQGVRVEQFGTTP